MAGSSSSNSGLPPVIAVDRLKKWLPQIFPDGIAHRNYVVREMAAKTIFVMLYTGAVAGRSVWLRPAQVTLMSDQQAAKTSEADRVAWRTASLKAGMKAPVDPWYATNSREPIRDETLRSGLIPLGAVVERPNIATTSSAPRYALDSEFAKLLEELEAGRAGSARIADWQKDHLSAEAIARVLLLTKGIAKLRGNRRIKVAFPNGETRLLSPGPSAVITKAVIESFARRFLREPAVLFVSESAEKVVARDEDLALRVGLQIEADRNLPDIILVDVAGGGEKLVFVEVVASSGAITLQRREALARLAASARFRRESVFFVTAFLDRGRGEFRREMGEVAWDSFVWIATEPENLICFQANARLVLHDLPSSE